MRAKPAGVHGAAPSYGPLIVLDGHMGIVETSGADSPRLRGMPCWAAFGCGIARASQCTAIRLRAGRPERASAYQANWGESARACVLLPLPGKHSDGSLLWCPRALPPSGLPNALQLQAGIAAALAGSRGRMALVHALRFLLLVLDGDRIALSAIDVAGTPWRVCAARPSVPALGAAPMRLALWNSGAAPVMVEYAGRERAWRALDDRLPLALAPLARTFEAWMRAGIATPRRRARAPAAPLLSLRCLGPFEVRVRGVLVPPNRFMRRAARTLLQMLALHAGKPVHRERLIEWLWPAAESSAALNRLHGLVNALHAAIEPENPTGHWEHVRREGEGYLLSTGPLLDLDLTRCREGIELAQSLTRAGAPAEARIRALESVVACFRGDLFEDDPYAEWCVAERQAFEEAHMAALEKLAGIHLDANQPGRALPWLRRAVWRDPYREDIQRVLVSTLGALGRWSEARRQSQIMRRVLREELGLDLSPESQRLIDTLLSRAKPQALSTRRGRAKT